NFNTKEAMETLMALARESKDDPGLRRHVFDQLGEEVADGGAKKEGLSTDISLGDGSWISQGKAVPSEAEVKHVTMSQKDRAKMKKDMAKYGKAYNADDASESFDAYEKSGAGKAADDADD